MYAHNRGYGPRKNVYYYYQYQRLQIRYFAVVYILILLRFCRQQSKQNTLLVPHIQGCTTQKNNFSCSIFEVSLSISRWSLNSKLEALTIWVNSVIIAPLNIVFIVIFLMYNRVTTVSAGKFTVSFKNGDLLRRQC